jgi:hypothetical protein
MTALNHVFSSLRLRQKTLKNRIVFGAHTTIVKRHPALRDMATPTFTGMAGRHWRADRKSLRAPMAAVALRSGVGELQRVLEVAQAVAAALDV